MGRRGALLLLIAAALLGGGCGDDNDTGGGGKAEVDTSGLKEALLPRSFVPSEYEPDGVWVEEKAAGWVGPTHGIVIPESTLPATGAKVVEQAGFRGGAAEKFSKRPEGDTMAWVGRFESAEGAKKVLEYMHAEDLKQPCRGPCVVAPREMPVEGIPGAVGVYQKPLDNPPPGAEGDPFEAYYVEFTIGPMLYAVSQAGKPGELKPGATADLARRYYARVR